MKAKISREARNGGSLHPVVRRIDVGLVTRLVRVVDNNATGELMRDARLKSGLSVRELARRLKLSAPYVSDLELGRRKWTEAKIEKWADILCAPNDQADVERNQEKGKSNEQ